MTHFIIKRGQNKRTYNKFYVKPLKQEEKQDDHTLCVQNVFEECSVNGNVLEVNENKKKKVTDMDTQEKIMMANAILNQTEPITKVKKVRKDKGLIEKTESSKIILTEDNRELLND